MRRLTRGGDRRGYSHSCDCVCAAWGCQRPAPLRAAGSGALSDQSALSRRCSTPLRNFHLFECIPGTSRLFPLSLSVSHGLSFSLSHSAADSSGPLGSLGVSLGARAPRFIPFVFVSLTSISADRTDPRPHRLSLIHSHTQLIRALSRCAVDIVRLPLHSTKGARERGAHGARQAGCTHDHLVEQRAQARAARVSRGALGAGR